MEIERGAKVTFKDRFTGKTKSGHFWGAKCLKPGHIFVSTVHKQARGGGMTMGSNLVRIEDIVSVEGGAK